MATGTVRAEPDRARCTSAACARRCWRGCSPARPGAASCCGSRTSTRRPARPSTRPGSSPTSRALGLDWDGPVVRQSERRDAHEAALADLVARGLTYPCFCSRREIREASAAPHAPPGAYPGTCRDLTAAEVAEREAEGRPAALRLRGDGEPITIVDRLRGERHPAGRRHRAAPQRRRARVPRGRRRRRRRPGRGGGGARRRPARRHARARRTCSTCSGGPARRGRTCRWCSVPTASASPSATAPSSLADLAAEGVDAGRGPQPPGRQPRPGRAGRAGDDGRAPRPLRPGRAAHWSPGPTA